MLRQRLFLAVAGLRRTGDACSGGQAAAGGARRGTARRELIGSSLCGGSEEGLKDLNKNNN